MSHTRTAALLAALIATTACVAAQSETHVPCNTLPPAVLHQAKIEVGDATIRGCVQDRENGKLSYEVETLKDGRSKDIALDASGSILEVEREIAARSLPTALSVAIARTANGGEVGKIESVTREGVIASYETTISNKGRRHEIAFSPQRDPVKAD
jgi:hypothetical protein